MQRKWIVLAGTFTISALIVQMPPFSRYVAGVKEQSGTVQAFHVPDAFKNVFLANPGTDAELLERIRNEAAKLRVEPINARVDRIWKAIPGYNGVEVDIDQTYKLSKGLKPGEPLRFVMREIQPEIGLEDLGAQPIYKGNSNKRMVSLMINVAWGDEYLPKMLEVLEQENVHTTFFLDGTWLSKHVDTARTILQKGHELSNHAYSHKNMSQLSRSRATEEIVKTQKLLEDELGVHNTLFAPPSGDFDQETVDIAHSLHLKTILWTLDTVDWKNPSPESVIRKIASRVEPGSLILMHPTPASSQALEAMIREIKRKGLAIGTVSEVISTNRVPPVESAPHF
jgi:probable sporulation protein (polysaccharide deacetylase family)